MKVVSGNPVAEQQKGGSSRFESALGETKGRSKAVSLTATTAIQSPASVRQDVLVQLQQILEDIRLVLNGIAELLLAGGGAGDQGKASTDPGQPLRRFLPSAYGDGRDAPAGADRPGARAISNAVSASTGAAGNKADASDMFWLWGQFMDHDIDLSKTGDTAFSIPVPAGDTSFTSGGSLDMNRSAATPNIFGASQQVNVISALIDASNVYGSDMAETASLRSGSSGRLTLQADGSLPFGERGFYVAGDERVNENIGLTSMHTVFAREHNRLADQFSADNPSLSDDQVFEMARARVTAQVQAITVNEFLPILFGGDGIGSYGGYVPGLDAQVSNSFAAAAYRFGHSMVSDSITPLSADGTPEESIALKDAFFNPAQFADVGIDAILKGFASQEAQAMDTEIVDSLRNFVLEGPASPRLDLAALNIQRGRDHGLPTLNDARQAFGFAPITSFDDSAFRDGAGARLASVYASPDDIDLWVGLLSEKPTDDGLVGPTQEVILRDQFERLRAGDADWYEASQPATVIAEVNATSLADVIARNTGVSGLSDTAMIVG